MIIGAMNHPGRDPVEEIHWIGAHGFDFVDLTLEPPGADEHVPGPLGQLEMIEELLRQVPLLAFHLDSGHAKLEGKEDRWDDYLRRLGTRLGHVHLSENDGSADQHLPLASAPFSKTDWPAHIAQLKQAGYDGTITLEVFAPDRRHLILSRELLRQWWDAA